jgi:hypothetical protein
MRSMRIGGLLVAACVAVAGSAVVSPRRAAAGGTADTKNVDELIAVVEGEFITRRTLIRDVGERNSEDDERTYDRRLRNALYARAVRRIFVHAGEQIGLTMTPDAVEEQLQWRVGRILESARAQAEQDKPGSGAKITMERILAEMGKTMEEFRSETAKAVIVHRYFLVLQQGVPGKRAVIDVEPSPEDLRRLYAAHRDDISVKRGARFAFWALSPIAFLEQHPKWDDALVAARTAADRALAEFRRDGDAARVATLLGVKKEEWTVIPPGTFIPENLPPKVATDRLLAGWLFAPGRKAGDGTVIEAPQGGYFAVSVIEMRAAQPMAFDDVKDKLAKLIRDVRTERFRGQHLLGLLSRAQVWPTSLAEELEDQQRAALLKLDEDPVKRDIRLR